MILAIFFLILTFSIGLLVSSIIKLTNSEKIIASFIAGIILSTWLTFLPALLFRSMKAGIITGFLLIIILLIIFRKKINFDLKIKKSKLVLLMIFLFTILILMSNFFIIKNNNTQFNRDTWGDIAIHLTLLNSFSKSDNFPPTYPIYSGKKMGYPFLFDFYSAILNYLGLSLKYSILIPNILMMFCLLSLFYFLALRITKKQVAIIALILLIFSGGLGFMLFLKQNLDSGLFLSILTNQKNYTNICDSGFCLFNFLVNSLPQRTSLIGFATFLLLSLLLVPDLLNKKKIEKNILIIYGILSGLLVMFHTHSFLNLMLLIFTLSVYYKRKDMIYFFIPAIILMLFQQYFMFSQIIQGNFISLHIGWIAPKTPLGFINFWIKNLGILLLLYIMTFFITKKQNKILYLAALSLFVVANLIQFQPWIYDNHKIILAWVIFVCIGAAESLYYIYKTDKIGKIFSILFFLIAIFSGLLTVISTLNGTHALYNNFDIEVAEWITENTDKKSVFLTGKNHNHLVPMLCGKTVFRSYPGWLWSHGINDTREKTVRQIYEGNLSVQEIKQLKINYIYISQMELNSENFNVNTSFFENNFEKIYENKDVKIYKA